MGVEDRKIPVSLRVPKSIDDFFSLICTKTIIMDNGERITFKKNKSDLYIQALEFSLENAESWLRTKIKR